MCPEQKPTTHVAVSGTLLARNALLNLAGRAVPLLVAIFTVPYVIHHLGADRYGLYSLALIVVGYFALFNLGIGPATTKYVAELLGRGEIDGLADLVWTAVGSQLFLGLAGGLLLAAASPLLVKHILRIPPGLQSEARTVFLIMAVALPVDFVAGSFRGVLAASQRFDLLNAVNIPVGVLMGLIPVAAIALGYGLPAIVFGLVLLRSASVIVVILQSLRIHPSLHVMRFQPGLVRALLGFGGWVTAAGVLGPILLYTDRFVIGAVVSIAAVGYYSVAFDSLQRLQIVPGALVGPLMPAFSSLQGAGDLSRTTALFVRAHKYIFFFIAPCVFAAIVFANNIFQLWIGHEFALHATLPLQIIAAGMMIGLMAPISGALAEGRSRPDLLFWIYLAEVPINIVFTLFLASRWGIVGAALSFTIRTIVETGVLFAIAVRSFGMKFRDAQAALSAGTITLAAFSVLILPLLWVASADPLRDKILLFGCAMAVYVIVLYFYALDEMERGLLWGMIGRRRARKHGSTAFDGED